MLNNYFDKIYCINMVHREDRWKRCNEIFTSLDIVVEKVSGVVGPVGWLSDRYPHPARGFVGMAGCVQSHLDIMRSAINVAFKKILILEDDVEFAEDFQDRFKEFTKNVPSVWDMLYLGGIHQVGAPHPVVAGKGIMRVFNMLTSHAIGYRVPVCEEITSHIINDRPYLRNSIDGYFTGFQKMFHAYASSEPLAWQRASHSDVQNGFRNYEKDFKEPLT